MWGAFVGSPVSSQSLKYFWLEECIEGEGLFVAGTYHKILAAVAKPALEHAIIKCNTPIVGIHAGSREDDRDGRHPAVVLETSAGARHLFDEVVVTAPLGWLKRHTDAFEPRLPKRLEEAIDAIGYGTLDKVYITFPGSFWNGSDSDESNKSHHPGFTHWLKPEYAPSTNPLGWDPQAMNLAALPKGCEHPTLLFYVYGDCSKHIGAIASASNSDLERDRKLLEFFEPYYSRLPNYTRFNPECTPQAVLATAWAIDEYAGYGSYSNFQTGLSEGDTDIETMRKGVPDRGIYFAGEHTAPFVALGTTTGAYWSGEAVAIRILEAHGTGVPAVVKP